MKHRNPQLCVRTSRCCMSSENNHLTPQAVVACRNAIAVAVSPSARKARNSCGEDAYASPIGSDPAEAALLLCCLGCYCSGCCCY